MNIECFSELAEFKRSKKDSGRQLFDKTDALDDIVFPPVVTAQWEEQVGIFLIINIYVHVACSISSLLTIDDSYSFSSCR